MQLKKLTLQAFGPFKDKVIIDFEKDKIDRGLLLISGDTGAGKTTIFDAVCYALYGQTSGETRTANSLRSDWASPETETYVNLEFYYKNKLYEVRRSPEYIRKKKNGEGETKQAPTAEVNINGRIITKVNEVTKEIENLIGLDYKQFRQVAMLSQGEFTKFLLASSEEKTTIFRKIFGTEFYDIFQNKLKSNRFLKEEEIKKVKDKIDTEKKNLEPIIDIYGLNNEETINTLENKIKEDSENVLLTKTAREKKNETVTKLTNEVNNLNELNKKIKEYLDSKNKLEDLFLNNINIKKEKEQYDYNINVCFTITDFLNNLNKDNKNLTDKKERLELSQKDLENSKKEYKEKEDKFNKLNEFSKNVEKITNDISELSKQLLDYDKYLNKKKELDKSTSEYQIACHNYEKENNLYENMRRQYYLNISVEIADTLKEGEECPVCGSIHHPKKALSTSCEYTKEDLQRQETKLKNTDSLRKKIEAIIEEIKKSISEFNINEFINIDEEKTRIEELLSNKRKEKDTLEKEFNILSKTKESLTSNIKSLEDNINIYSEDIKLLEANIKEITTSLEKIYIENNTCYEDYINRKLDRFDLQLLRNKIENYTKTKNELESIIKVLEPEIKDKQIVDLTELEKQLTNTKEEYLQLDKIYTDTNAMLVKLRDSSNNIKRYIDDNKKVESEYAIIKVLSDTANGALTAKKKITFENFVQSYFMNTVLVEANKRLTKMTDSRYELKKKEIESKLNLKTGLDFAIFDSYTGKERDVASLSGGEKFKASLALALGLSDTISNNRGGIKIDSLFIDEGFGSLDAESLNQALNILSDLSGNDKLVGVISHVSELMSRIDNKILVNKTNTGSIIRIESNS